MPDPEAAPAPAPRPVVLITGTSSGIGREAVAHLRRAGALAVATARRVEDIADLAAPGEVECVRLDVTDAEGRAGVVAGVLQRHGRIDALVNNAGYGATLAVEDTRVEVMEALLAANVLAPHDLARRVLPAMRRQGHGRIVNVASIAGHVSIPMMGAYCASKFALRALTQAMHNEVRRFGVRALLVEPGVIRTRFGERSLAEAEVGSPARRDGPYGPLYRQWDAMRHPGRGAHPRAVARRIVRACLAHHPPFHSFVPWDSKAANLAKRLLPDAWLNAGLQAYFRGR